MGPAIDKDVEKGSGLLHVFRLLGMTCTSASGEDQLVQGEALRRGNPDQCACPVQQDRGLRLPDQKIQKP